ncbi:MAG: hemerythrin domain-containing protein [Chloroflexi bacterium]|jgi:iron-sulfur cluster repair protein YtfE (RIC family)|nr:hemerythrin domain-containing protein [Chloroflexota bacterium]MBI3340664.1 hemerythrin domain-containing protein [Chloroflexota bacterium]
MNTLTQPLRDEHKELFPQVDRIRQVAELVGEASIGDIRSGVDEVYDFLANHLKPHAEAEEAALYPVVQKVLGSPDATKTMSRDHVEVGLYIDELALLRNGLTDNALTAAQVTSLRRVLYGVYALVKVHFAKEEEVYLPILDQRLTPESAQEMFEAMETAAHNAKHAHA